MKSIILKGLVASGVIATIVFSGITFTGEKSMAQVKTEVVNLVQDKASLNTEINKLKEALKELHTEATKVIGDNKEEHKALEDAIKKLEDKVKGLEESDLAWEHTAEYLKQQINGLNNTIATLEKQLAAKDVTIADLNSKLSSASAELEDSIASARDWENKYNKEVAEHDTTKARMEAANKLITEKVTEIRELKSQLGEANKTITDLNSQLATSNANATDLQNKLTAEQAKSKELADKLATAEENLKLVDGHINDLTKELEDTKATLAARVRALDYLLANGRPADQKEIQSLTRQLEEAKTNDTTNTEEANKIQAEIKRLEGEVFKANQTAEKQLRDVQATLKGDKVDVSAVQKAVDDALAKYKTVK